MNPLCAFVSDTQFPPSGIADAGEGGHQAWGNVVEHLTVDASLVSTYAVLGNPV
jgi:hypothetical protein